MVFQEGKSIGVMGSYNRIGLTEAAGHYGLMTEVLRNEWGFKGCVLSDMAHPGNSSVNYDCYESINLRMLAGNNTQLTTSGSFESDIDTQWDSSAWGGKGAVVLKNDKSTVAWSMWYAMRELTKGYMYMASQCEGFSRGLTDVANNIELTLKVGEEFSQDISIDGASSYKVNARIDLPENVTFDGDTGVLSGKIDHVGLYRIDIIGNGKAVQVVINVVADEADFDEDLMELYGADKPGNGGNKVNNNNNTGIIIGASVGGCVVVAGIIAAVIAILKKKKIA